MTNGGYQRSWRQGTHEGGQQRYSFDPDASKGFGGSSTTLRRKDLEHSSTRRRTPFCVPSATAWT